jgi:hypothetical protein
MKNIHAAIGAIVLLTSAAFAQADIHSVDFKNFTYAPFCISDEAENVTVKDGEFSRETQEDGYVDRYYFSVFGISYGDLNGDGRDEAVVLASCNTGGTGNFSEGFVYKMAAGKPVLAARIPGGDRAYGGLHAARVENGLLVVESNDVGAMGGACCPEFRITTRYKLVGGKIVQQGAARRAELYPSTRVTFARGTSGTTMKVRIDANDLKRFVVGARAGQTLDVSVNSDKASIRIIEEADVTEGANSLRARLSKNGDYTIEVQNLDEYPIEVTLNVRIN